MVIETLDLFFRKACYHWNAFYKEVNRNKSCGKPLDLQIRLCSFFGTWFIRRSYGTCKKRPTVSMRSKVRGFYGTSLILHEKEKKKTEDNTWLNSIQGILVTNSRLKIYISNNFMTLIICLNNFKSICQITKKKKPKDNDWIWIVWEIFVTNTKIENIYQIILWQ